MERATEVAPTVSGIVSTGRPGSTIVPNWRVEDVSMDPHTLRVACWLASHADHWPEAHVTRNMIAKRTGVSAGKVSGVMEELRRRGIASAKLVEVAQRDGGKRWVVTFHHDVWEQRPRSSGDHPRSCGDRAPGHVVTDPGHVVTATRALQREEQVEVSSSPASPSLELVLAEVPSPDRFDEFWAAYGNLAGTGKRKARECWAAALKRGGDPQQIIDGLIDWVAYWRSPGASKAMYAQGFLNQEKWTVVPPPTPEPESRPAPGMNALRARFAAVNAATPVCHDGREPKELQ